MNEEEPITVEELQRRAIEAVGIPKWFFDYANSIELPVQPRPDIATLNNWEKAAYEQCFALTVCNRIAASFNGDESKEERGLNEDARRNAANAIGAIIAEQLLQGRYYAPSIIAEGLENLEQGREFKPLSGRQQSEKGFWVRLAFYHLKSEGISKPSQKEVREFLAQRGHPMSRPRISKYFDELGLKEQSSDAREAISESGKRKRKKR